MLGRGRASCGADALWLRWWLKEAYPALARKARGEGAVILWCDEADVAADAFLGRGYARKGYPAAMEVPKPHIRITKDSLYDK